MRQPAIQTLLLFLLAFFPFAFAQETTVSTYFLTRTVYRVYTETKTGTPPASTPNVTATYSASVGTIIPSSTANYTVTSTGAPTVVAPTTTAPAATFTGAASQLNANAIVAAVVAGVGYMVL